MYEIIELNGQKFSYKRVSSKEDFSIIYKGLDHSLKGKPRYFYLNIDKINEQLLKMKNWYIVKDDRNEMIGAFGLYVESELFFSTASFVVLDQQNKGLGKIIRIIALNEGFKNGKFDFALTKCHPGNIGSLKINKKLFYKFFKKSGVGDSERLHFYMTRKDFIENIK